MRLRTPFRPALEGLEQRIVPYALSGYQWANVNVSASFMPDGTITDAGSPSNLVATLNARFPTAMWQREFARALQTWADVSPLNFRFVSDNGAAAGTPGSAQGDSRFGDIRLGGYVPSGSWVGYGYYPVGGTLSGDQFLNTAVTWEIGTFLDTYSVLLHETGHALGLDHSDLSTAVMYGTITRVFPGLSSDDIAGIQAIYGARQPDALDAAAANDSFATASALTLDGTGAVTVNADLTTMADVDYLRVTAPASFDGTLTVSVDASNLSLLSPKISVYGPSQNLLGTVSATTYGTVATATLGGLTAGQTYYLAVDGATADVFGMGAYQLRAQFGGAAVLPSLTINNVSLAEGNSGGTSYQFTVNLSAASSNTVTVQYTTANGTATAGSDYTATSGTLTFAPGQTQQTLSVTVNGDTTYEPDETFTVNLGNPTNATLGVGQGQGTIRNDDLGPDRYEANNTAATATDFGRTNSVSQTGLTLHTAADVDYYKFSPTKSASYVVTVTPTAGSGTLSVVLLNAQQSVIASGQSQTGGVTLTATLTARQAYYVKVWSPSGSLFTYNLSVAKSGGGALMISSGDVSALVVTGNMVPSDFLVATARQPTVAGPVSLPSNAGAPLPAVPWTQPAAALIPGSGGEAKRTLPSPGNAAGHAREDWFWKAVGEGAGNDLWDLLA